MVFNHNPRSNEAARFYVEGFVYGSRVVLASPNIPHERV